MAETLQRLSDEPSREILQFSKFWTVKYCILTNDVALYKRGAKSSRARVQTPKTKRKRMNSFACLHASSPCACSWWYCSPVFERNETGPFLSLWHQPQITQQSVMGELKLRKKVVRSELFEFLPAQLAGLLVPRKAESQPGDVPISDLTAQFIA